MFKWSQWANAHTRLDTNTRHAYTRYKQQQQKINTRKAYKNTKGSGLPCWFGIEVAMSFQLLPVIRPLLCAFITSAEAVFFFSSYAAEHCQPLLFISRSLPVCPSHEVAMAESLLSIYFHPYHAFMPSLPVIHVCQPAGILALWLVLNAPLAAVRFIVSPSGWFSGTVHFRFTMWHAMGRQQVILTYVHHIAS